MKAHKVEEALAKAIRDVELSVMESGARKGQ